MTALESREANQDFAGRRLVLGFDAGCMTCSDLARRIEEQVGDKMEVRPLDHPQVAHWREQALGENATWVPTLVEVKGNEVKAWTGLKMALILSQKLGPVGSWRVMQLVGEIKSAPQQDSISAAGISRGQFLKKGAAGAVGGTALAFGISGVAASPVLAVEDEVDEEELIEAFSKVQQIPDSVIAQGDKAASEWLRDELENDPQYQARGAFACSRSILSALAQNIIPISKIKAVLRTFGGAVKLARFIGARFRRARRNGKSVDQSIIRTIRAVSVRTRTNTGEQVAGALETLFALRGVRQNCF